MICYSNQNYNLLSEYTIYTASYGRLCATWRYPSQTFQLCCCTGCCTRESNKAGSGVRVVLAVTGDQLGNWPH